MRRIQVIVPLALLGIVLATREEACAGIVINGDFETPGTAPDPFAGWTTTFGQAPIDASTSGGNHFALFDLGQATDSIELEQNFQAGIANQITFDYRLVTPGTGTAVVPSVFQVTLYDPSFQPLFSAIPDPLFPAFFTVDADGQETFDPTYVTTMSIMSPSNPGEHWRRVTLQFSPLELENHLLEIVFSPNFDDRQPMVSLDNVTASLLTPVPEPSTLSLITTGILFLAGYRVLRTSQASRRSTAA